MPSTPPQPIGASVQPPAVNCERPAAPGALNSRPPSARAAALRCALAASIAVGAAVFLLAGPLPLGAQAALPNVAAQSGGGASAETLAHLWPHIAALGGDGPAARLTALNALREDPLGAREALLLTLLPQPEPGRGAAKSGRPQAMATAVAPVVAPPFSGPRHRLFNALIEFGLPQDVPALLTLRDGELTALERQTLDGLLRSLYETGDPQPEPSSLIFAFSFVQSRPPQAMSSVNAGNWRIGAWSMSSLHRDALPPDLLRRLEGLGPRTFAQRGALEEAIKQQLGAGSFKEHGHAIMLRAERVPSRVALQGQVRTQLRNPLPRPLLIEVSLGLWNGVPEEAIVPRLVYMEPGQEAIVTMPVKARSTLEHTRLRIDLRLKEINGRTIPSRQKIYVPVQP